VAQAPRHSRSFNQPSAEAGTLVRRVIYDRLSFLFMVALAASFLLLGRAESFVVEGVRGAVTDVAAPVLEAFTKPVSTVQRAFDNAGSLFAVHEENARLRDEIARLKGWEMAARKLDVENKSLKRMLDVRPGGNPVIVTARVIADTSTPFVRSLIINEGQGAGIEKGQAVHSESGLVGRIDGTSRNAARILLVTDLNSRIPVKLDGDNARGIAKGTNGPLLKLGFLPADALTEPGVLVVTSGDGGLFPADIPVGVIERHSEDGILVRPVADLSRLDFVKVLSLPHMGGAPNIERDRSLPRLQGGLIGSAEEQATKDRAVEGAVPDAAIFAPDSEEQSEGLSAPHQSAPRPTARPANE